MEVGHHGPNGQHVPCLVGKAGSIEREPVPILHLEEGEMTVQAKLWKDHPVLISVQVKLACDYFFMCTVAQI